MNEANFKFQLHLNQILRFHFYALIFLIPLLFCFDTQTIFTLPKLLALRVFSLSAGGFILLKFFFSREIKFIFPRRAIFLDLWSISLILSTVFSLNPLSSLFGQYGRFIGLITMLNLLFIPIYIANFFSKEDLKKLMDFSIGTAVLAAIYALFQHFNFFELIPSLDWTDSPQNRLFGTMGHANHLGAYLSAHFLMLACRIASYARVSQFWSHPVAHTARALLGGLSLLLMATVILLTASRGAVLALILAAIILSTLKFWKNWQKISQKRPHLLIASASVILLLFSLPYLFPTQLEGLSLIRRTEQNLETINKGKTPERLSLLLTSWQIFLDHPLLGTGLSTFRDSFSAYRRSDYFIDGPGNLQYITVPESTHNEYLNTLSTQGLFGLIAYLSLIIAVLSALISQFRQAATNQENWQLALLGGLLVGLFQAIFNFGEIINLFIFYLLIGIVLAQTESPFYFQKKFSNWLVYPLVALGAVLIILAIPNFIINPATADSYLQKAYAAQAKGQLSSADQYYKISIAAYPQEYQLHQAYADFSLESATRSRDYSDQEKYLKQAIQSYQRATELNPNYPSTYHNLALAHLKLFRLTKNPISAELSRENYQKSIEKSPNNPRYLYEFARKLHSDWNDRPGAVKLLKQALEIAPDYREPQDYLDFLYKNHPDLLDVPRPELEGK
jgi:tetratricopeptide (TPR) repeat protein